MLWDLKEWCQESSPSHRYERGKRDGWIKLLHKVSETVKSSPLLCLSNQYNVYKRQGQNLYKVSWPNVQVTHEQACTVRIHFGTPNLVKILTFDLKRVDFECLIFQAGCLHLEFSVQFCLNKSFFSFTTIGSLTHSHSFLTSFSTFSDRLSHLFRETATVNTAIPLLSSFSTIFSFHAGLVFHAWRLL